MANNNWRKDLDLLIDKNLNEPNERKRGHPALSAVSFSCPPGN